MDWTQIIGLAAGICTATSLLPQVVKTIKEKKAEDVSLVMLLVLMAGIILWIVYGIQKKDLPITATNSFVTKPIALKPFMDTVRRLLESGRIAR